jgi:DNA-directed RNA polymerase subunit delta
LHQIKERLAYLKGLADGLNIGETTPEGRVLVGIMDMLSEMSTEMERLRARTDQLEEYIEAVDDDLTDLENGILDDDYDADLEDSEVEHEEDVEDEDDSSIEYMEINCPNCGETVFVDSDVFESDEVVEVLCPECKQTVLVNDERNDDGLVTD